MAVSASYEGRTYPPAATYVVGREDIGDFARAVGASDAMHTDVAAARAAGHRDVVAPPTYAVKLAQRCEAQLVQDPQAGIDFTRVVHGEQRFVHHRPLVAGDEIAGTLHVDRVREVAGNAMISTRVELATAGQEPVCTVTSMLVVRAGPR